MIKEPVPARRFRGEKAQQQAAALEGDLAIGPAAFRRNRPRAQREAGRRDAGLALAGRAIGAGPVPHQAGAGMGLLDKELEGGALDLVEERVIRGVERDRGQPVGRIGPGRGTRQAGDESDAAGEAK